MGYVDYRKGKTERERDSFPMRFALNSIIALLDNMESMSGKL